MATSVRVAEALSGCDLHTGENNTPRSVHTFSADQKMQSILLEKKAVDGEYDDNCTDSTTISDNFEGAHTQHFRSSIDSTESSTEDDYATVVSSHFRHGLIKRSQSTDMTKVSKVEEEAVTAWKVAEVAMEGAVDGLVAFATELIDSVAAATFGETKDINDSADNTEMKTATLACVNGTDFELQALDSLMQSTQLEPPAANLILKAKGKVNVPMSKTPSRSSSLQRISTATMAPMARTTKPRASKRVAIVVNGSEGDVRPLIALARSLKDNYEHTLRILTNVNLVHVCIKHGIDAVPVYADSLKVVQNCGGLGGSFMEAVAKPAKAAEKWLREHKGEYVAVEDALEDFQPHVVIVGAQALKGALRYEHAKQVLAIPVFLNRPWLEEETFNFIMDKKPPRPSLYPVSQIIDRKPVTCKTMIRTGAWVLNEAPTPEDLAPNGSLYELKQFLEAGPPPVAIGWGSMMAEGLPPADMLDLGLRALLHAGKRGVILGGWAELDRMAELARTGHLPSRTKDGGRLAAFAAKQVCFVSFAPHEWLFPRCCCVIHHGGVGTTQAALRAGKPSVITPVCADQFTSAEVVQKTMTGIGFTEPLESLSVEAISRGVRIATGDAMTLQAEMTGRKLQREENQALSKATEMLDGYLRGRVKIKNGQLVRMTGPAKKGLKKGGT